MPAAATIYKPTCRTLIMCVYRFNAPLPSSLPGRASKPFAKNFPEEKKIHAIIWDPSRTQFSRRIYKLAAHHWSPSSQPESMSIARRNDEHAKPRTTSALKAFASNPCGSRRLQTGLMERSTLLVLSGICHCDDSI